MKDNVSSFYCPVCGHDKLGKKGWKRLVSGVKQKYICRLYGYKSDRKKRIQRIC